MSKNKSQHTPGNMISIWSDITCGESCWHAKEEICRCSCGGKNHGCLNTGDARPERTAKIAGHRYRLFSVGKYRDILGQARELNNLAGYREIHRAEFIIDGSVMHDAEDIARAKQLILSGDRRAFVHQYAYPWRETEDGAPARIKTVSANQWNWPELSGWRGQSDVYILWQRIEAPARPSQLIIDRETCEPATNQNPQ